MYPFVFFSLHRVKPALVVANLFFACSVHFIKTLHSGQLQISPHLLQQIIKVPLVMGRHRYCVGNFINDVQFFNRDLIDFIQAVDARHIDTISLDNIDQIVHSGVTPNNDVGIVDLILAQN